MEGQTLTHKQRIFIKEYLVDFNGTRAAIAAGYSPKAAAVQAVENLRKPKIQEAIKKEIEAREKRIEKTGDDVLQELWNIALLDMADYLTVSEGGGLSFIPFDQLPEGATKYIQATQENRMIKKSKDGETMIVFDKIKFKHPDKLKALELLGRHHKLFVDRVETKDMTIEGILRDIDGRTAGLPSEDKRNTE